MTQLEANQAHVTNTGEACTTTGRAPAVLSHPSLACRAAERTARAACTAHQTCRGVSIRVVWKHQHVPDRWDCRRVLLFLAISRPKSHREKNINYFTATIMLCNMPINSKQKNVMYVLFVSRSVLRQLGLLCVSDCVLDYIFVFFLALVPHLRSYFCCLGELIYKAKELLR